MPQTQEDPEVVAALNASGYAWDSRYVGDSDTSYFHLIEELWRQGETFATVEHDIVINPDTLSGFEVCSYDWCVAPYPYAAVDGGYYAGLGCCRIRDNMIGRHPKIMKQVWEMEDAGHPKGHWCRVDGWLRWVLEQEGERFHAHGPDAVGHLGNTWPTHGCVKPPANV